MAGGGDLSRSDALKVLRVSEAQVADAAVLRSAYRTRLRAVHPDVNPSAGAAEATERVTAAYRLLSTTAPPTGRARQQTPTGTGPTKSPPRRPEPVVQRVKATSLDARTIRVGGSRREVFAALLEAAQRLGEVTYFDRAAGLVEAVVEFIEAPTSSVVLTMRSVRSVAVDVSCTVEPLSGGDSPPIEAVTRLVASTLAGIPLTELVT